MKKFKIVAGIMAVLLVSACSSNEGQEKSKTVDSGYKVEHVHGLAYTEDDSIFMASHEGLITTKDQVRNGL